MTSGTSPILQFVADGAPGGGTTHVLQLLANKQLGRHTLLTQHDSYLAGRARELGVDVHTGDFFASRLSRQAVHRVRDVIEKVAPELVHAHGGRANFFLQRSGTKCPNVYTVHGFHHRKKSFAARFLGAHAEKFGIARTDHVVFVSQHDQQVAIAENLIDANQPNTVVHNGIALDTGPESSEFDSKSHHDDAEFVVGFIGRLVEQKNPHLFVKAMNLLPDYKCIVVGGGDQEEDVRGLASRLGLMDRMTFLGAVPREQVITTLKGLSCLVMTSRWEGLPILPLESMLLGTPVVSTPAGGMVEIIEHEKSGLLIDSDCPEDFAAAITSLKDSPETLSAMRRAGIDRVRSDFSEQRMVEKLAAIYSEVCRPDPKSVGV